MRAAPLVVLSRCALSLLGGSAVQAGSVVFALSANAPTGQFACLFLLVLLGARTNGYQGVSLLFPQHISWTSQIPLAAKPPADELILLC